MFWADQLIVYVNSAIEMACALCVLHFLCGTDVAFKKYKVVLFYAAELVVRIFLVIYGEILPFSVLPYIVVAGYTFWQYKTRIIKGIIFSIMSLIVPSVVEILVCAPCLLFQNLVSEKIFSLCIVLITFFIIFIGMRKLPAENRHKYGERIESYAVVLFLIVGIVVLYTVFYFHQKETISITEYFYSACCLLVIVLSVTKLNHDRIEKRLHKEYSARYVDVLEQIRGQQHKFSNQIDAIYAMHNLYTTYDELVEKQQEQVGVLKKTLLPNGVIILNNPIVIAHVYQKINEILELNINLQTDFSCSLDGLQIPDIQLVNIIGTLLDNAMEALEGQCENREMYFHIKEYDREQDGRKCETGICIEVGNAHSRIPMSQWRKFFERGYSEKGANRGLGLSELRKIVLRFNGNIIVKNKMENGKNFFSIAIEFETI